MGTYCGGCTDQKAEPMQVMVNSDVVNNMKPFADGEESQADKETMK